MSLRSKARKAAVPLLRARRRARAVWWQSAPQALRSGAEVVGEFDYWHYLVDLAEQVAAVLRSAGIDNRLLTQRELTHPIVVVPRTHAKAALAGLATDPRSRNWYLAIQRGRLLGRARLARRARILAGCTGVLVCRNLVSAEGIQLTHSEAGVLVEFWPDATQPDLAVPQVVADPDILVAPRLNGLLDAIGPQLWAETATSGQVELPSPSLLQVSEPVDLVYTWVDGADPGWRARKAAASGQSSGQLTVDADVAARFESHDELRYSLRSVEMFANWVRHIWVVTDQQRPDWLREDDRLTVVDHREIFTDPTTLPVFNSHAIESQLHHISGLAELYLYLNDDMLFGAPVRPEDFFHGNQISKFFPSTALIDLAEVSQDDLAVTAAAKNNRRLIETEFAQTITNKLRHTPQPQRRSTMQAFEDAYPELFDQVMRSNFRSPQDYSLTSSLAQYWAFGTGRAVPGRVRYAYLNLAAPDAANTLERWLFRRDVQCICLNDTQDDSGREPAQREAALGEFLRNYYPLPSRWEAG